MWCGVSSKTCVKYQDLGGERNECMDVVLGCNPHSQSYLVKAVGLAYVLVLVVTTIHENLAGAGEEVGKDHGQDFHALRPAIDKIAVEEQKVPRRRFAEVIKDV